jgi:stress response protein YsnF
VAVGRVIAETDAPQTRYEGETLVVPVLEEVLVVQKQLLLKEEIRITRHRKPVRMPQNVLLRSEQVTVERFDETRE